MLSLHREKNILSDLPIAITGSAGAIGSVLTPGLAQTYEIVPIDVNNKPSVDMRDYTQVRDALPEHLQAIIFLSWNTLDENWQSKSTHRDNDLMFENLVRLVHERNIPKVMYASSVHADQYEKLWPELIRSNTFLSPSAPGSGDSPYGNHKLTQEQALAKLVQEQQNLYVAAVRFGWVNAQNRPDASKNPRDWDVFFRHHDCITLIQSILAYQVPRGFDVVYGISKNAGLRHDLSNPYDWEPTESVELMP